MPFHMPGHLLGRGLLHELKMAGSLDITEIPGSDCLHAPDGVIKESQELTARCFGADYTLFLVNGSTSGIHSMISAVVKPKGKLIIGRDCHKSVLNALALIDAEPVFVTPVMDEENQIPLGIKASEVEIALHANPDVQGILLTRPNYYGVATPLEDLVGLVRSYRVPLLVDEAHGAHFRFHKSFPMCAIEAGADLCVQSLHKTLPALTQTALLHGNANGLTDRSLVEMTASMVQTTSPSYILMASIDMVRGMMENEGEGLYEALINNLNIFNSELAERTVIYRVAQRYDGFDTDLSRIVLSFKHTSLSGFSASELLRQRWGIVAEMADSMHVVLIASPFHEKKDFERLLSALETISAEYKQDKPREQKGLYCMELPDRAMSLREALFYSKREVPIKEAAGAVCAIPVIPYPPGIPLLNPGERITRKNIKYLLDILAEGSVVHGVHAEKIQIVNTKD